MNPLVKKIATSVIGQYQLIKTPFGNKPLIYADYTASGRSLFFIENYITKHVLPCYANTHNETSVTGAQTTHLREEARDIIKNAINATHDDKIIFCGSGATAAINKVIDILGLRKANTSSNKTSGGRSFSQSIKPVVFIGPYEHHSNELPWRESIADVVVIPLNEHGAINTLVLEQQLKRHAKRPLKIGSFSAASNVTGIISDVPSITAVLKEHGALSFWDYAAAAPYMKINMNAEHAIDAAFISPHKFIGGPGTPGILAIKASVIDNPVPTTVGGGTVSYVTPSHHTFIHDIERREEGGTPAIVESIRAGLVFKLQQEVGTSTIESIETEMVNKALAFFSDTPEIKVLGNRNSRRLSIFSLCFKYKNKELHYGFVAALLNDLFGIQVRGGCSCAGPYGHHLLDIDSYTSQQIEAFIDNGHTTLRPGWVRLNFNYFISNQEFDYILQALKMVSQHGWRMLPFYKLDKASNWRYQGDNISNSLSLRHLSFSDKPNRHKSNDKPDFKALLKEALSVLLTPEYQRLHFELTLPEEAEKLRWFILPQTCFNDLIKETSKNIECELV